MSSVPHATAFGHCEHHFGVEASDEMRMMVGGILPRHGRLQVQAALGT